MNQSLETDLDSEKSEGKFREQLREVETCYAMQMEQFNGILLHLEFAGPDPVRWSAEHQGPAGGRVFLCLLEKGRTFLLMMLWTTAAPRNLCKRPPSQNCGWQSGN